MGVILRGDRYWVSPYFFACFVSLREKEASFEVETLDSTAGEAREASYVQKTLTGRVPSLEHDGFFLAESSAIVEYVDEAFDGTALLPRDAKARARCRQVMSWLRSDETMSVRAERPTTTMFYAPASAPLGEEARRVADKACVVARGLLLAQGSRGSGRSLFGRWSILDAELAFFLHRLLKSHDEVPEDVRRFAESVWARPSVRAFVERERPMYVAT
jgi:glutathione S-transferase